MKVKGLALVAGTSAATVLALGVWGLMSQARDRVADAIPKVWPCKPGCACNCGHPGCACQGG